MGSSIKGTSRKRLRGRKEEDGEGENKKKLQTEPSVRARSASPRYVRYRRSLSEMQGHLVSQRDPELSEKLLYLLRITAWRADMMIGFNSFQMSLESEQY